MVENLPGLPVAAVAPAPAPALAPAPAAVASSASVVASPAVSAAVVKWLGKAALEVVPGAPGPTARETARPA